MSGVVSAVQIDAISSAPLASSFTNTGGTWGLGVLTVNDTGDIVVEYVTSVQTTFTGGHVLLTTYLFQDLSAGGIADGDFRGGGIVLTDNVSSTLLTANIVSMRVTEIAGNNLTGHGTFTVIGGSLATDFGGHGEVFQLTTALSGDIQNFSIGGGTGVSKLDIAPIPEPTTCLLFATAGLSAFGWMRRRRVAG